METQCNIIANKLDYLEIHSDESNLRLKKANSGPVVNNKRLHILLQKGRRYKFLLDTQNCSASVVLKPI